MRETPRLDRRHDANVQQLVTIIALVVTLLVNVASLAWGAAKLATTVEGLQKAVTPLVNRVEQNTNDISVLKDRYQRSKQDASE